MSKYDIAILGGGPGGYEAALRAASNGFKTVLVEKGPIGGVCLNWGCIPTKTLLSSAKFFDQIKKAEKLGFELTYHPPDWKKILARKDAVVSTLKKGMRGQLERAGVQLIEGTGTLKNQQILSVKTTEGERGIEGSNFIIATGSRPRPYPNIPFDNRLFLSSDNILDLSEPPQKLVIIGGGVIGVEFASLFHSFGTEVVIVELLDRLLPQEDSDLGKRLEMSFKRRGIEVHTHAVITGLTKTDSSVAIQLENGKKIQANKALISIGRSRNTEGIGLEAAGVKKEGDAIEVNNELATNVPHIFAIGDVTGLPQLAHTASFGGELVIHNLKNPNSKQSFPKDAVPNCIFSSPLIASVGLTRIETEKRGMHAKEARVLLSSQGRAHVEGELEGHVKLVMDERTGILIGGHVMGGEAAEVIGILALAVSQRVKAEDLSKTIFPHPTYHEIIRDAARALQEGTSPTP
jgi:dihydrolipoamide dehydrogenase